MKQNRMPRRQNGLSLCIILALTALLCWLFASFKAKSNKQRLVVFAVVPLLMLLLPIAMLIGIAAASYFFNGVYKEVRRFRPFRFNFNKTKAAVFISSLALSLSLLCLAAVLPAALSLALPAALGLALAAAVGFWRSFAQKSGGESEFKPQIELFGNKIDSVLKKETAEKIDNYLTSDRQGLFHVITADSLSLLRACKDKELDSFFKRANLVVPDGMGILWAADFKNTPLHGRVAGVELVSELCRHAAENNLRLYFVGAAPNVANEAVKRLKQKYNINVCGVEHGYFEANSPKEQAVINNIKQARPDIVFAAMGVPKQEYFIDKLREASAKAVAVGVGGSFDIISETLKRAPVFVQKCGLEWLFRLWLEPKRLKKMLGLPVFMLRVFMAK